MKKKAQKILFSGVTAFQNTILTVNLLCLCFFIVRNSLIHVIIFSKLGLYRKELLSFPSELL